MSFRASLSLGELGEKLFYEAHPAGELKKEDGHKADFLCLKTGQGIEIKTDYWAMTDTPNFFFEHFSNKEKQTPGGPWQSLANGINIFIYFFIKDLTYYRFDTQTLVTALESMTLPSPTNIKNKTYITEGYLVPRDSLTDICTEHKLKVSIK